MKKEIFASLIERLTAIEPNDSPLISCFVDLEHPRGNFVHEIEIKANLIAKNLSNGSAIEFEEALEKVYNYVKSELKPSSKSVAIYCRQGEYPIFLPMQFEVPLTTQIMVDDLPHIYPLIELKDVYHRFVIAIVTDKQARILETTIGSVTEDILEKKPELRQRIGREWTKEYYHNYREEQSNCFIKEKIDVIERLMEQGGHNHLVLAGSPKMVAKLKHALPARLSAKIIDTLSVNPREDISSILTESIKVFVAVEEIESHRSVNELVSAMMASGLAVCGKEATMNALQYGNASKLIIDQNLLDYSTREQLTRLAASLSIPIETVSGSDVMERLGGVGCLLRYVPVDAAENMMMVA